MPLQTVSNLIKTVLKYLFIAALSGCIYILIELLWRGYSTPEMFGLAAICGLFITGLNNIFDYDIDYIFQIATCGLFCTAAEWICGMLFNQDYHIWDYRNLAFGSSPDGQINIFFSLAWCLIAAFSIPLLDWIEWKIFRYRTDTPPYYMLGAKKIFQFKEKG